MKKKLLLFLVLCLGEVFSANAAVPARPKMSYDLSASTRITWPNDLSVRVTPLTKMGGLYLTGNKQGTPFSVVILRKKAKTLPTRSRVDQEWREILELSKGGHLLLSDLGCTQPLASVFKCSHTMKQSSGKDADQMKFENVVWNQNHDRVVVQVFGKVSEEQVKSIGADFEVQTVNPGRKK